jgi:hypothetical protein
VNGTVVAVVAIALVALLLVVMYVVRHRSGHDLHLSQGVATTSGLLGDA